MDNTETKFKRGDVVFLNSNPERRMTVVDVWPNANTVATVWILADGQVETREFNPVCLTLFTPPAPSEHTLFSLEKFDAWWQKYKLTISNRTLVSEMTRDAWKAALIP